LGGRKGIQPIRDPCHLSTKVLFWSRQKKKIEGSADLGSAEKQLLIQR